MNNTRIIESQGCSQGETGASGWRQPSRRMRSELDGIKPYRVLFQDCMLFIARKPGNVVGF